ncbi:archaellin/type IV pilin N-terminal domain-containing protein [Thermoproteota archaeon]
MKFTKLIRNKKAISPIFATLILIAIAVIAGIVVYMFTSGTIASMTGGGTAGQEKVAIQAVEGTGTTVTIYAQSTGGGNVTIDSVIIKTADGTVYDATTTVGTFIISDTLTTVAITDVVALDPGTSYTATIVSVAGNQFVSPSFKAS